MSHNRNAKRTVEQCHRFGIGLLKQVLKVVDVPASQGETRWGTISWFDSFDVMEAVLGFHVGRTESEGLILLTDPELTRFFSA